MPKSKSAMMKRLYQSRKDAGLVLFKAWVTPSVRFYLEDTLPDLSAEMDILDKEILDKESENTHKSK